MIDNTKAKKQHEEPAAQQPEPEQQPSEVVMEIVKDVVSFSGPEEVSTEPFPASIVDDVLKMKREWVSRRQAAIDELLKRQKAIVVQLAELDYNPEPQSAPAGVSTASPAPAKRKYVRRTGVKKKRAAGNPDKFCPICNQDTPIYPHDGRSHRNQKKKKAFTESELKELAAKKKV
jgi:hypothetical protein